MLLLLSVEHNPDQDLNSVCLTLHKSVSDVTSGDDKVGGVKKKELARSERRAVICGV